MNENTMNDTTRTAAPGTAPFRPKLSFFHPNGKGTGGMVSFELHPAHGDEEGSVWVCFANQLTVGDRRAPNPTYPRFDWENTICVKLGFLDLCQFLQVLRGECETINGDRGTLHRSPSGLTRIQLRHLVEPVQGYSLELYKTPANGGEETRAHMLLNPAEALGLCESIAGSLYLVSFGIPMLVPHDTAAYRRETREAQNAAA